MAKLSANNGDPDLGLHCLPITLLGVSRLQQVSSSSEIFIVPVLKFKRPFDYCFQCLKTDE